MVKTVWKLSGGNPFWVVEIAKLIGEDKTRMEGLFARAPSPDPVSGCYPSPVPPTARGTDRSPLRPAAGAAAAAANRPPSRASAGGNSPPRPKGREGPPGSGGGGADGGDGEGSEGEGGADTDAAADAAAAESSLDLVVVCRFERLTVEQQQLLRFASLIGKSFYLEILEGILRVAGRGTHWGPVEQTMAALVEARFMIMIEEEPPAYQFYHDFVQASIRKMIPKSHRQKMHFGIGTYFRTTFSETNPTSFPIVAEHYLRSGAEAPRGLVVEFAARAALHALHLEAAGDFRRYLGRARERAARAAEAGALHRLVVFARQRARRAAEERAAREAAAAAAAEAVSLDGALTGLGGLGGADAAEDAAGEEREAGGGEREGERDRARRSSLLSADRAAGGAADEDAEAAAGPASASAGSDKGGAGALPAEAAERKIEDDSGVNTSREGNNGHDGTPPIEKIHEEGPGAAEEGKEGGGEEAAAAGKPTALEALLPQLEVLALELEALHNKLLAQEATVAAADASARLQAIKAGARGGNNGSIALPLATGVSGPSGRGVDASGLDAHSFQEAVSSAAPGRGSGGPSWLEDAISMYTGAKNLLRLGTSAGMLEVPNVQRQSSFSRHPSLPGGRTNSTGYGDQRVHTFVSPKAADGKRRRGFQRSSPRANRPKMNVALLTRIKSSRGVGGTTGRAQSRLGLAVPVTSPKFAISTSSRNGSSVRFGLGTPTGASSIGSIKRTLSRSFQLGSRRRVRSTSSNRERSTSGWMQRNSSVSKELYSFKEETEHNPKKKMPGQPRMHSVEENESNVQHEGSQHHRIDTKHNDGGNGQRTRRRVSSFSDDDATNLPRNKQQVPWHPKQADNSRGGIPASSSDDEGGQKCSASISPIVSPANELANSNEDFQSRKQDHTAAQKESTPNKATRRSSYEESQKSSKTGEELRTLQTPSWRSGKSLAADSAVDGRPTSMAGNSIPVGSTGKQEENAHIVTAPKLKKRNSIVTLLRRGSLVGSKAGGMTPEKDSKKALSDCGGHRPKKKRGWRKRHSAPPAASLSSSPAQPPRAGPAPSRRRSSLVVPTGTSSPLKSDHSSDEEEKQGDNGGGEEKPMTGHQVVVLRGKGNGLSASVTKNGRNKRRDNIQDSYAPDDAFENDDGGSGSDDGKEDNEFRGFSSRGLGVQKKKAMSAPQLPLSKRTTMGSSSNPSQQHRRSKSSCPVS